MNSVCMGMVVATILAFCPAVAAEKVSGRLLQEAKAKASHIEKLIAEATQGDPKAQYQHADLIWREGARQVLDRMSRQIKGVNPESVKAALVEVKDAELKWLLRAAHQGLVQAQWRVVILYENKGDHVSAYAWNRLLFRKHKVDSVFNRDGVEKPAGEWLRDKMTTDQITEAERLSREIERKLP